MCVLCDEEEDPFVEDATQDQAKEERSLVPRYMYGNMYGYEGSDQEYNSSEEFERARRAAGADEYVVRVTLK